MERAGKVEGGWTGLEAVVSARGVVGEGRGIRKGGYRRGSGRNLGTLDLEAADHAQPARHTPHSSPREHHRSYRKHATQQHTSHSPTA
eukprot:847594-Rhodomonas_salina.1